MKTKLIIFSLLSIGLNCYQARANEFTSNPSHLSIERHGNYIYTYALTSNGLVYVNPNEFWNGVWKEDTNGWRVQLRVCWETNTEFVQDHVYPISTNLIMRVEWGSMVKNSGRGYYLPPNGKFAKIELKDNNGNLITPNPNAGINLLERNFKESGSPKFIYETNLPAWMALLSGSLVSNFPKTISTDVYPYVEYNIFEKIGRQMMGEIPRTMAVTNWSPCVINALKLDEIYSVTNEGDYTLTVQPVLYKKRIETNILDRVDLPSVTTKVHLVPNEK
jgi:hypothetical protein